MAITNERKREIDRAYQAKFKHINIKLSPHEYEILVEIALVKGLSPTTFVSRLVKNRIKAGVN